MSNELITAVEMAKRLRVQPVTVRLWARQGTIPAVRVNPKVLRFDPDAVIAALQTRGAKNGR